MPLPFEELRTYSTEAIRELADTIDHFERGGNGKTSIDRGVLDSLQRLGTVFDRKKVSKIEWIIPGRGRKKRRTVVYNAVVQKKVEKMMRSLPQRASTDVEGLLEMADFKPEDRKCRIDPPLGRPIVCTFAKSIEEIVYSVLRLPVRASGIGEFNTETHELDVLHIEKLEPIETVLLGAGDFESGKSLAELVRSQGVKPLKTIKQLEGGLSADEPLDELIEEIYAARV